MKHLGKNSRIEIYVNLPNYSVVLPKNPNAQSSPYYIFEGTNVAITTQEQSEEGGDSTYTINHDQIVLKQIVKQNFSWSSSYEKVFEV